MITLRVAIVAILCGATFPVRSWAEHPLWPGSRFTEGDRASAIRRGIEFIYRTAMDQGNFGRFGSDYLWCFYEISATSADARLRA